MGTHGISLEGTGLAKSQTARLMINLNRENLSSRGNDNTLLDLFETQTESIGEGSHVIERYGMVRGGKVEEELEQQHVHEGSDVSS
mmetsp:Transcript_41418/g.60770  ORF Transcript_41418/g.60770 Transcript_41418/m.60770 type:complete len:86 (-) Transcript_41418:727-984(-)